VEETIEQCVLSDKMGYDYLWFVEHHFLTTFSGSSSPEVILGALSRLTKQIRLGFGVVVLPHDHPIRVAEKVAMVDQISGGRVDFGTGRSSAYEQLGFEVDPRNTRDIWEESLRMIPEIWQSDEFQWAGTFWNIPPRRVHPKPLQKPHPPIWVAAMQPETYRLAAERGIGVLAFSSEAPSNFTEEISEYKAAVKNAKPVGAFINDQWANFTIGHCGEDNTSARELGAQAIKAFLGPDRPYTQGRSEVYSKLLEAWGGVPDHLKSSFGREAKKEGSIEGGADADLALWQRLDANTLCDRGVIVAGDPDSCIEGVKLHQESGADQLLLLMQCDQVPHEKVMSSIELFGREVIPAFRR
jgi:alkanesulfonate monooxygenase SsuD/methylene tetrahydromethanopterin reductase-like flavin-dependent oxidoreductase (luciferase family)